MNFFGRVFSTKKGFTGVAKIGLALFGLIVFVALLVQFIIPTLATTAGFGFGTNSTIDISLSNLTTGRQFNITINNSLVNDGKIIIGLNISFDSSTFAFVAGSNRTSNGSAAFNDTSVLGNLTWKNTTLDGFAIPGVNMSVAFNFTVINKTQTSRTLTLTYKYNDSTLNFSTLTIDVKDDVAPVINVTTPPNGEFTNTPAAVIFTANLTEDNPGVLHGEYTNVTNVTLSVRRTGSGAGSIARRNMTCFYGSSLRPNWNCNATVDLTVAPLSALDGDVFGFWFNATDLQGNVGVNGTPNTNFTLTVDTTIPMVKDAIKNSTADLNSTNRINVSVTVTDTNRNDSHVIVSGNLGGTNLTINLTANNAFNGSLLPTDVGCPTNNYCTFTFYGVDSAENVNTTSIVALIDINPPNVSNPFANVTTFGGGAGTVPLVKSTQIFKINVTVLENFNISNVTFGDVITLGGTNHSSGNWSISTSASNFGCLAADDNCTIRINATDRAGNSNSSGLFSFNITIDDIRPNVTLSAPGVGNSTITATVSFNISVLEKNTQNASGVVQITPSGQSATNYTLTNNTGSWGFTNTTMPNGVYTALFFINDTVGNQNNSVTVTFAVDTNRPAVSNSTINDTVVRGSQIIRVTVNMTDTNRNDNGLNVSGNASSINSSMSLVSGATNIFETNATFTAQSASCKTGSNNLCILIFYAADAGGNINSSHNITVTVDDSNPNVTITSPGNFTTGIKVSFNVTVTEENSANESVNVVQITPLSAGQSATNFSLINRSGDWGYTNISMPDGVYNARFFIYDAANNVNNTEAFTFTVDTVSPVINTTTPSANGTVSNVNAVLFRAKVVELNLNKTNNISVFYKRKGASAYSSNLTVCGPDPDSGASPPHYVCNLTVDVQGIAGISSSDVMEFFFSMNDSQRQLNTASNGTSSAPMSASVDSSSPVVNNPVLNKTGVDFQPTSRFNVSITVTDAGSGINTVYVSGNTGATNVSMQSLGNNNFNVSTRPTDLGCATNGVCTIRFYANDTAGNINNDNATTIFVDSSSPNVTTPFTNVSVFSGTSPVVKSTQLFRINVTVLENFNISNVTFGNATMIGGINQSNGNWSISNYSATNFGCTDVSGVVNNCRIYITATDNATNSNSSVFVDITVDDIAPNVTLTSPSFASGNTSSATINFNASVLEPNAGSGLLEILKGNTRINYTLTNRSGNWGYTNLSVGTEGVYKAIFRINDSLGNENFSVTVNFTLDITAPNPNNVSLNQTRDKKSTAMFNLTANVTDTNRVDTNVNASGNSGGTNVTLTLRQDNKFQVETNGSALGCPTAGICTITVYARDAAGILSFNMTTTLIDDVVPNVTTPFTNVTVFSGTSPLVTGSQPFRINATAFDNFNISNVTFGNVTALGGTNATTGSNWSRSASANDYGCTAKDGFLNNCRLTITATDNATNSNGSIFLDITVDDTFPNVTITSPANVTNGTSRVINFNATVLEVNPGSGVVQVASISPSQTAVNYSLANNSGNWGFTNLSMPDGTYRAQFFINDSLGNLNLTQTVVFTINLDVGPPNVTITSPTNTTIVTSRTISFNATVLETNPGTGVVEVTPLSAGQGATNYSLTNRSGDWGFTNTSMPDGTYFARFHINDSRGNMNNTESIAFTITLDTAAPTGSIVSITPNITATGSVFVRQNISINFTIADAISPVSSIQIMFRNSSGNFSIISNYTNTTFPFNTTLLADGNYTIVLNATDTAGNTNHSVAFQNITIFNTRPTLVGWNYSFISKNLTLVFDRLSDSNTIVLTSINVTSNSSSLPSVALGLWNNGLLSATPDSLNSSKINITLTYDQDVGLRSYSGIWGLYIKGDQIKDITGNLLGAISARPYGTLTDFFIRKGDGSNPFHTGMNEITGLFFSAGQGGLNSSYVGFAGNYSITKVLESVDGNYNAIYALSSGAGGNGGWTSFVVGRPTNDFVEFRTDNTTYHINITAQDRIEIGKITTVGST